jgi:hypothetical protein
MVKLLIHGDSFIEAQVVPDVIAGLTRLDGIRWSDSTKGSLTFSATPLE